MFVLRFLKFAAIFLCLCLPIMMAGAMLLPFYLPFSKSPQLPFLLRWFDCADFYFGRDTSTYRKVAAGNWWDRYTWLAFRNPMNYFDYKYLGLKIENPVQYLRYKPLESRVNNNDLEGLRHIELLNGDGKQYFEYFYIKAYTLPFTYTRKCVRIRIGWKIKDNKNLAGDVIQWVFVVSLFHPFTGE